MSIELSRVPRGLDRAGVVLSSACAVHCAATPLAAGLLATLGVTDTMAERFEGVLLLAAAVLAIASLPGGCRHHRQWSPWLLAVGGLGRSWSGASSTRIRAGWKSRSSSRAPLSMAAAHVLNWLPPARAPAPAPRGGPRQSSPRARRSCPPPDR
jgi:hypothetical protein